MTDCLFCRIIARKLPGRIVYEDDEAIALEDIHPQAPVHLLILPRRHLPTLQAVGTDEAGLLGRLFLLLNRLAKERGIAEKGYRVVINCNAGAGQTVFHLHLHLLGGRPFRWPPG